MCENVTQVPYIWTVAAALAKTAVIATSPAGFVAIFFGVPAAVIRAHSLLSNAFAAAKMGVNVACFISCRCFLM